MEFKKKDSYNASQKRLTLDLDTERMKVWG